MQPSFLITLTSENRPGVLTAVTTALAELGGNMEYSAQAVIRDLFSMTLAARFPAHRTQDVVQAHLQDVGRPYGMDVQVRCLDTNSMERPQRQGQRYFLTVHGQDAPGVLRAICAMLAQECVEIERMYAVPDGPGCFSMVMILDLPVAMDLLGLNGDLELFSALNGLSISLQDEKEYDAADLPRNLLPEQIAPSRGL